jgi:hypothetical protein
VGRGPRRRDDWKGPCPAGASARVLGVGCARLLRGDTARLRFIGITRHIGRSVERARLPDPERSERTPRRPFRLAAARDLREGARGRETERPRRSVDPVEKRLAFDEKS